MRRRVSELGKGVLEDVKLRRLANTFSPIHVTHSHQHTYMHSHTPTLHTHTNTHTYTHSHTHLHTHILSLTRECDGTTEQTQCVGVGYLKWEDRWCVSMFYRDNIGWQLEGGVQNIDDLHSVKEDYHSSAGTTWDILDLVRLESGYVRGGKN